MALIASIQSMRQIWACEGNQITVPQVHLKLRLIFYNQLSPSKMFVPLAAGESAFGTAAMNLGSTVDGLDHHDMMTGLY